MSCEMRAVNSELLLIRWEFCPLKLSFVNSSFKPAFVCHNFFMQTSFLYLSTETKWANPHIILVANAYHTYDLISTEWIIKNGKLVRLFFFTLFSLIIKMIWQISTYPRGNEKKRRKKLLTPFCTDWIYFNISFTLQDRKTSTNGWPVIWLFDII